MYPAELKYSKDHEWIAVTGDRGRVGITDYAQQQLGDVVYVQLPPIGQKFAKGDIFGTVESVKAVSDLFSPVSGEVVEVNNSLTDRPETVNKDPHGAWMIVLKLSDPAEASSLLNNEQYAELVK
jgi:glycine cleavage system H protein